MVMEVIMEVWGTVGWAIRGDSSNDDAFNQRPFGNVF